MKRDEKEQKIWNKKVGCSIKYFTFATNKEAYRRTQKKYNQQPKTNLIADYQKLQQPQ